MLSTQPIRVGLETCLQEPPRILRGARLGLLMNQASVEANLRYACDVLAERFPGQLVTIFTPQHGLWGEQQANMIETPHSVYSPLKVPLYSLYSETRAPSPQMLDKLDVLLIDLQGVGTRVYTFAWTISHCLQACARSGIPVVLLDRPNPLGGEIYEGPILELEYASFVGRLNIPMRHGLTIGELALLTNRELSLGAKLEVVPMQGWRRSMLFPETGRAWLPPSPNMPRWETAMLYPGQVLLEGTNLSEGRGSTTPFELVGAPFVDAHRLTRSLEAYACPGVACRPVHFRPTFDKWRDASCGGVALHILQPREVRSYAATLAVLACARRLCSGDFRWLPPPYEYETRHWPIDILSGSNRLRESLDAGDTSPETMRQLAQVDEAAWLSRARSVWLYS